MKITDRDWELLQIIWDYMVVEDEVPTSADAIVIGGSGMTTDSALRAAELYHAGVAPVIVASGFANPEFSASVTEAEMLADVLIDQGVPPEAIKRDHAATNTGDNITNSANILKDAGIYAGSVILIHKPFMTRRFLATALAQWPQPQPRLYVTSWPTSLKEYHALHARFYGSEDEKMIYLMLGDYERIKSYPAKGFSVKQPESPKADAAYEQLAERGFTIKEAG